MVHLSNSLYEAIIHESVVDSPGIQYYITAADSYITTSDPKVDPALNPYDIAVHPNEPPLIIHTPIKYSHPAVTIGVSCEAIDSTNSLVAVKLYFRKTGTLSYTSVGMVNTRLSTFSGFIPGSLVTFEGVDYYLSATDDFGVTSTHGTSSEPHRIAVGTEDGHIISDGTWKSSGQYIAGWHSIDFDDSVWNYVYVLNDDDFEGGYSNQPTDYLRGITKAEVNDYRFIWDSNGLSTDEVWFRKSFNIDPSNQIDGAIFTFGVNDDYVELYLNGILLGQNADGRPSQFEQYEVQPYLKGGKNVLAIHARYSGTFSDPHHNDEIDPNKWLLVDLAINPEAPPMILEVEDMNFNTNVGYEYDGGFVIPRDKVAEDWIFFPRAQNYKFTIRAKTLSRPTSMKLWLRQAFEETVEVNSTIYQNYEFESFITSAKHRVDIMNLGSSGLVVDWIMIEPMDTLQHEIIHVIEAEGMPIKQGGRSWGFFWELSSKGSYVGTDFTVPIGSYRVTVVARRLDDPLRMLIHFDDTRFDVQTTNPCYSFIFENSSGDAHTIRIEAENRSLYLDKVIVYAIQPGLAKNIEAVDHQTPFPNKFAIAQNYPNPFNPETKIEYQLAQKCHVMLKIYNYLGQEVRSLVDKIQEKSRYDIHWDGQDNWGENVPSGIYFYVIKAGHFKNSKKMIKLK